MKQSKSYKIIGVILTFVLAFMTVSNYSGYANAEEESTLLREQLSVAFEQQQEAYEDVPEMQSVVDGFIEHIDTKLVPYVYRQKSLYRLVGCIVALLGIALLRSEKFIGFHLFLGGMLIGIIAVFYMFGFGVLGWIFNVTYVVFTTAVATYYFTKRKELIQDGE